MKTNKPTIVVVGSLNLDLIASVRQLPLAGQTIAATGLIRRFGGKGANQAVAAARQGSLVRFIGCVGDDDAGRSYLRRLRDEGIDSRGVAVTSSAVTGTALIAVDAVGENLIVVAAGANGKLTATQVKRNRRLIEKSSALLLQFEVPMPAVIAAVRVANEAGVPVVLNPSPIVPGFPWGKHEITTLITNAGEAGSIMDLAPEQIESALPAWRRALARRRIQCLVITRGSHPTLCITKDELHSIPALRVKPVDTVGAGDAFAGTYTARLAEGLDVASTLRLANCAGALATLKAGAQESIPGRAETDKAAARLRS